MILPNAGGRFIKYPRSTAACERNAVDSRPYHASPTVGRAIVLMEINGAAPMVRRQLDHQDQNEAGQSQNQGSKQYQARQTFTLPGLLGGPSNLYVRSGHSFRFPVSDGVSRDRISLARSFPRAVLNGKALGKRPFPSALLHSRLFTSAILDLQMERGCAVGDPVIPLLCPSRPIET